MRILVGMLGIFFVQTMLLAQPGKTIRFTSSYTPFPDSARVVGHRYNGVFYDKASHYNDSSVLMYVPQKFNAKKPLSLVVWFHGWLNNIDSANNFFKLIEQFEASGRNAVLVFPEGPKNAPDSYGGKMERKGVFAQFVNAVVQQLIQQKIIPASVQNQSEAYTISLAGHSGAYRVMGKIIQNYPVKELILFDALYGSNEAFIEWASASEKHRLLAIYTKYGGTFDNTHTIFKALRDSLKINCLDVAESGVDKRLLKLNPCLFIYSSKAHNEVITNNNNWERFLKYSANRKSHQPKN